MSKARRLRRLPIAAISVAGALTLAACVASESIAMPTHIHRVAALPATPVAAAAGGGSTIASAPVVTVGQQTFGDTSKVPATQCTLGTEWSEYWKLALTGGDRVRLDWEETQPTRVELVVYPPSTNDFNVGQSNPNTYGSDAGGKQEAVFTVDSTGQWPISFTSNNCQGLGGHPGAYDFVVYVTHSVRLFLPAMSTISARSTVTFQVHSRDGRAVSDSALVVRLYGHWNGAQHLLGHAPAQAGLAAMRVALPRSLRGTRISIWAIASGANYAAARSTTRTVTVH